MKKKCKPSVTPAFQIPGSMLYQFHEDSTKPGSELDPRNTLRPSFMKSFIIRISIRQIGLPELLQAETNKGGLPKYLLSEL
ncbi:MAG: hypothetical protein H7A25_25485 [Leptospiraceae bacterium]|nr:hypothetical protein [Leptospiraceae bacterium]MCP5503276.1 hypothetical protein [Leptospiraceae bacterium]